METDYQTALSKRYAFDIICLVYENEKIMATEMLRVAKNYRTVIKTADVLVDNGILEMGLESGKRLMKIYTLTPKGKSIGKHMYECREIMGDVVKPSAPKDKDKKPKKKKN